MAETMTPTSDLQKALNQINNQADLYRTFDNYYNGSHAINFASDKFKQKFGKRLQHLRDNLCKAVVQVPASRLELIGFGADKKEIKDAAWQIWKKNKMPRHATAIHREAFKAGDAYVIVWYDPKDPQKAKIFPQNDKTASIVVWKSEETGETEMAAKAWIGTDLHFYLTIYYPDRIEKFISRNEVSDGTSIVNDSDFVEREIKNETFPLYHDLGRVPVVHFSNGESILTDVIPVQAALNKGLADLFVGMEYNSLRQRWTSGISYPVDEETGKAMIPFEHDDQWMTTKTTDGKFGEFSDMNLDQILAVLEMLRGSIARISGIPLHYLQMTNGDFPSGEALRKAEARLTELLQEAQISFGESWSEVMSICMQIEQPNAGILVIEPQWTPAAPFDQTEELANGILKKQLGWSDKQIQSDFGLDLKTITQMAKDVKKQATSIGQTLGTMFDQTGADVPEN